MKLTKSEKILISIAFFLFVLVILNKTYILPQKEEIGMLKELLSSKKELYKEYLFLTKNKSYFEKAIKTLEGEYNKIKDITWDDLPYQTIASTLLDTIDQISEKTKITILKKDILDKKAHPYFEEVRVSLEVKAPLPNILYFLYMLRNEKKVILVKKFSIYIPKDGLPVLNIELATLKRKFKKFKKIIP